MKSQKEKGVSRFTEQGRPEPDPDLYDPIGNIDEGNKIVCVVAVVVFTVAVFGAILWGLI